MYLTLADVLNYGLEVHTVISQNRFERAFIPSHPVGVEGNLTLPDGDVYHSTLGTHALTSCFDTRNMSIVIQNQGTLQGGHENLPCWDSSTVKRDIYSLLGGGI